MRKIKFRVWAKVDKYWLEYDEIFINQEGEIYLIEERNWAYQSFMYQENITEKVEITQFTGLKDKNGKDIYEGDILKCHHNTLGNVFYHDGAYRLSSNQCNLVIEDIHSYDDLNNYLIEDNDLVVIGNIYENPELMES